MKFTVGKKLYIGFMIMLLITGVVGWFSISYMSSMNQKTNMITNGWMPGVETINNLNYLTEHVFTLTLRHINTNDAGQMSSVEKEREDLIKNINYTMDQYGETISLDDVSVRDDDQKNFTELTKKWNDFLTKNEETVQLSKNNRKELANQMFKENLKISDQMQINLDFLVKLNHEGALRESANATKVFHSGFTITLVVIVIGILFGLSVAYFLTASITKPLNEVTESIMQVSKGNLRIDRVKVKYNDELGTLANSDRKSVV